MNVAEREGGCWPTPTQLLLLRAALLSGKASLDAWRRWKARVHVDTLDRGSTRLLPLLYQNLAAQGVSDPQIARFKGVYRHTWYNNRLLFHNATPVLRAFHEAGIRTMALKGVALVPLYYRDFGVRPMNDFDLLVPTNQARKAIELLVSMGWTPNVDHPERLIPVRHGVGFVDAKGRALDLHWHVLQECCQPNADADFWACSVPVTIGDVPTLALNPTDQLLHVCVHGLVWNAVAPLRWVADAVVILGAAHADIDWQRLVAQARKRRLVLPVRHALNYLRKALGATIPRETLSALAKEPVSRRERLEYRAMTRPPGILGELPLYWHRYLRLSGAPTFGHALLGFPRYLQHTWRVASPWQVPLYAASVGIRRARGHFEDLWPW
jgi:hypothetical protein